MYGPKVKHDSVESSTKLTPPEQRTVNPSLIINFGGDVASFLKLVESNPDKIIILKFGATWCRSCMVVENALIKMAKSDSPALVGVLIITVDVDWNGTTKTDRGNPLFSKYKIEKGVPQFFLFIDGKKSGKTIDDFPVYGSNEFGAFKRTGFGETPDEISALLRTMKEKLKK